MKESIHIDHLLSSASKFNGFDCCCVAGTSGDFERGDYLASSCVYYNNLKPKQQK